MGTKEIKELIVAAAKVASLIEGLANGLDFSDIGKALSAAKAVPAALKDIQLAWDEYTNLNDDQLADLEALVATEFELDHDDVEAFIEKAFDFVLEMHDFAALIPKKK